MVAQPGRAGPRRAAVRRVGVRLAAHRPPAVTADLARRTVAVCMRYRVTGLAAEAGFFALLSLPPLVLGLAGAIGYIGRLLGPDTVDQLRAQIRELTATFLTRGAVDTVILPTFDDVLRNGRADIVSIGFLLSLWSGSRVLNVYIDTISIMYGLSGRRGIVRTRALSFSLYVAGLLLGAVTMPLVLLGPTLIGRLVDRTAWIPLVYWPVVTFLVLAGLTLLYHVSTPVRSRYGHDLPGAGLALALWLLSSVLLRQALTWSVAGDSTSIYGPLATPIIVLIWLYFLAISVLIGAAFNAAIDQVWPTRGRMLARAPEK